MRISSMYQWMTLGLFVGLLGVSPGCDQAGETNAPAPSRGTVAVVDVEAVARGLGKLSEWEQDLANQRQSLLGELGSIEQRLAEQLEEARGQLSDEPTEEEQQQLRRATVQAQQILQNRGIQANNMLRQRKGELQTRFRDQLAPIAREVADAQGFDVVLIKGGEQLRVGGDVVMSVSAEADITQAVLTEARDALGGSNGDAGSADTGDDDATDATDGDDTGANGVNGVNDGGDDDSVG